MSVTVRIPSPLRRITNGQDQVNAEGAIVGEVIAFLDRQFPGMKERLCDENGQLRKFVNVYVNGEDVRLLEGLNTAVKCGDKISILPAVAGG